MTLTKECRGCGRELPATREYFSRNHPERGGMSLASRCKACNAERSRKWYATAEGARRRARRNPGAVTIQAAFAQWSIGKHQHWIA